MSRATSAPDGRSIFGSILASLAHITTSIHFRSDAPSAVHAARGVIVARRAPSSRGCQWGGSQLRMEPHDLNKSGHSKRQVLAEGGGYDCDPYYHFDAALIAAEEALRRIVRERIAELRARAAGVQEVKG